MGSCTTGCEGTPPASLGNGDCPGLSPALPDTLITELKAADAVVIGAPIYKFAVPAALKAWIDLVARAGRTFRDSASGPEGMLPGEPSGRGAAGGGPHPGARQPHA